MLYTHDGQPYPSTRHKQHNFIGRYSVHAVSSEMHPQGKVNPKMQEAKMMELWETDPTPGSPESILQGSGEFAL